MTETQSFPAEPSRQETESGSEVQDNVTSMPRGTSDADDTDTIDDDTTTDDASDARTDI